MDQEIKRAILMDHYTKPKNRGLLDDPRYKTVHMASESCIDDIKVQMLIENDKVSDVRFDGVGCTICISSTSIISSLIKGQPLSMAKKIIDEYFKMIDEEEYDEDLLEEANAFESLSKQANRIKCGTIGIKAMKQLIKEFEDEQQ